MTIKKIAEPIVLLALGIALVFYSCNTLYQEHEGWATSAGLFPVIMGGMLILFGAIMLAQILWKSRAAGSGASGAPSPDGAPEAEKSNWLGVALVIAATMIFIAAVQLVGFLIAGTVYAFAIMLIFRDRKWIWMAGISVVSCVLLFFSFTKLLHVLLP